VQPNWDIQFRFFLDLFRKFVGAIGGTDDSARDSELLSDELKLIGFSTAIADWRAASLSFGADHLRLIGRLNTLRIRMDAALFDSFGGPFWLTW
jgi:hypothetical protein